ncbi:metal ABC transporter solute-binding protein, Zn/Mn family [Chloroflexota bacterium]
MVGLLPAFSCSDSWPNDKTGVAVTILPLSDFVAQVGGDRVEVMVIVPPGRGPHDYEPTPQQMTRLSKADMYAQVGSGVEFELTWMDNLVEQNGDMLLADCSEGIELLGADDEHEEDSEAGADPHIWLSPLNAKTMVQHICAGLIEVDPAGADYYTQNRDDYLVQLDELDEYIEDLLSPYTNRNFIIYHPSFGYFARDYDLTQIPIEHDGKEPTGLVMEDAINQANEHSLEYIYVAPQFNTEYAETIAGQIGGGILVIDPLPESYISNMQDVADAIALELE